MRIGIITYYRVNNFGANLQAISTYCFLKNNGHEPIFINYLLKEALTSLTEGCRVDPQWQEHIKVVDSIIKNQTFICQTADEVLNAINTFSIDGIIVGSDALLQHHPFITRIKKAKRKIFYIQSITSDRLFPNLFWGCGIADKVPMAMMSVSSQNSEYSLFLRKTKVAMNRTLCNLRYISVRDSWTQKMIYEITGKNVLVTPDPVFAFNQNSSSLIPTKEEILNRFSLPENYALLSLFSQSLRKEVIAELKMKLLELGISLVILPLPTGIKFAHNADIEIQRPLSPLDWYALLKYCRAYIGSNMHPIVTCLHNAVPCFSIDNWGKTDFWGRKKDDGSSKVEHIMSVFGIKQNHRKIECGRCKVSAQEIVDGILSFPQHDVSIKAKSALSQYNNMMQTILTSLR